MIRILAVISIFLSVCAARAAISIPTGLSDAEQHLVLQILGFGTAFRPVDNPYPLGGYSGFEAGISLEDVPTADIGYFGSGGGKTVDRTMVFPRLTIGKGIYDSFDLFFSFLPYNENTGVGTYGGALRWTFFQATFVPASFSLLVSANNTNVNNLFISQTEGADIISGVDVDPFSFYLGAGTLFGQGQFDASLTTQGNRTDISGRSFHTILGVNFAVNEVFSALEIDTYSATTVSFKLGLRL
jgi:hypothetical protein